MKVKGQPVPAVSAREREITILMVDDNDVFRDVLRDVIGACPGFRLVGEACSGEEATQAVARLSPQLVLMDLTMPGIGGIAAAREIVSLHPEVAIGLISVDDPSINPEVIALGNAVTCARKQDLRPRKLKELWDGQQHC